VGLGASTGDFVGTGVGSKPDEVGDMDGDGVGSVGASTGDLVGTGVGSNPEDVGEVVGDGVGSSTGDWVGSWVGAASSHSTHEMVAPSLASVSVIVLTGK